MFFDTSAKMCNQSDLQDWASSTQRTNMRRLYIKQGTAYIHSVQLHSYTSDGGDHARPCESWGPRDVAPWSHFIHSDPSGLPSMQW